MLKKFLRDPLLMFVVLGAVVFALYYSVEDTSQEVVELSEINRKVFAEQFEMLTGREATTEDREKIESDYIQEEVLFREAIKAGMYLTDPEVRSKLIEEMRYQVTGAIPEPEETELVAYYLEHIDRYFVEATYSFRHVYFEQLPENADAILAQLQAGEEVAGDEFWRGRVLPNYGISMIRGMFGKAFLDELGTHMDGQWYGPEESLLGWHYVLVTGATERSPLTFDEARMQVTNDYTVDKLQQSVENYIDGLGDEYKIIRHSGE